MLVGRSKTKKHGMLLDRPVDDDSRCRECDGACCRAFISVNLTWPEYEQLKNLGAHRLDFSLAGHHALIIENGCEFLLDGLCAIYDIRPDTCRRFFCRDD
jgi:Fe-S-cluster containining protein